MVGVELELAGFPEPSSASRGDLVRCAVQPLMPLIWLQLFLTRQLQHGRQQKKQH